MELNKDRDERRKYLTFEVVESAISKVYPTSKDEILKNLVKLITYDAIVGNNDRHFYNWGLIGDVYKVNNKPPIFAPIYDTARALLWSLSDDKVKNMLKQYKNGSNQVDIFITKSNPRFSYEEKPNSNHFEFINFLVNYNSDYRLIVQNLISDRMEDKVIKNFKSNEAKFFIPERSEMMIVILRKRFEKLRQTLL